MILYHGTNVDFETIDLNKKRADIWGGSPVVQKYEIDESVLESGELKVLRFDKPSREWADFIFKNRSRSQNPVNPFDIVQGPIADDGVAYLLNLYEDGLRTLDELAKELEYKHLNNQFCFLTEKALTYLRRVL